MIKIGEFNMPIKTGKNRKPHIIGKPQTIRRVSIDKLCRRTLSILSRDIQFLAELSLTEPLSDKQASTLIGYIKLTRELKKQEDMELANMSDEQLNKLAKRNKSRALPLESV